MGGGYVVVGVGLEDEARLTGECLAALCSLSLLMREALDALTAEAAAAAALPAAALPAADAAAAALPTAALPAAAANAANAAAPGAAAAGAGGGGGGGRVQLRIGIAQGAVAAGVAGVLQNSFRFVGDALSSAARLQRQCLPGEIRVQRSVAKEIAGGFLFSPAGACPPLGDPSADEWRETVLLRGRRSFVAGHWGASAAAAAAAAGAPPPERPVPTFRRRPRPARD